jgi:signal recognition particle GTPase
MSSAGGSTLAKTMSIPLPPQQVTGTKRALPEEDSDRPKKKARIEKKEGARGRKMKDEDGDYSEEEHSQTPPLSRVNSLGEDFDVNARLRLLEDQQKQMEQQLETLKGELLMKDFVFKPVSQVASTMADPQVKEKQEKEEPKPKKRGRPAKKK